LPVEVLYAAGKIVVDLNNIFITSKDPAGSLRMAGDTMPRTVCSWTRGVIASAVSLALPECVIVTEGDCAHTIPMMEVLRSRKIRVHPFEFPVGREPRRLEDEIKRLGARYGVSLKQSERFKEELDETRALLRAIDELTYRESKVTGFENHLYLVSASDFCWDPKAFGDKVSSFLKEASARPSRRPDLRAGYVGIPPVFSDFYSYISSLGCEVVFNETQRQFSMIGGIGMNLRDAYLQYTYPYSFERRAADVAREARERELDCVIHYVQSFCFHQIEDGILREKLRDIPILTLEGDRPGAMNENDRLKIESFLSSVSRSKSARTAAKPASKRGPESPRAEPAAGKKTKSPVARYSPGSAKNAVERELSRRSRIGIDLGSRSVKLATFLGGRAEFKIYDTMDFIVRFLSGAGRGGPRDASCDSELVREATGLRSPRPGDVRRARGKDIPNIEYFSTGYGRFKAGVFGAKPIPEIQCHAAGAVYATGLSDFTLLDIGGQDMKAIQVESGRIKGFSMNDKCAAGSGRYLENMARILNVPIEKLASCHENPVPLSITCATFGETEVVCKLMEGVSVDSILAGVNYTVYARVEPMLDAHRSKSGVLVVTSGIALNGAFLKLLKKNAGFKKIVVPDRPQWIGAIGACVYDLTE